MPKEQYKTKIGHFVYDTSSCSEKNYHDSFVNVVQKKKVATYLPTGSIDFSFEYSVKPGVGSNAFMRDSLYHRETVYNGPLINKINKNDYCFQNLFVKE